MYSNKLAWIKTLFPEMCVITHASKCMCAIYHTHKIIVFSLFVFLFIVFSLFVFLLHILRKEKFFIEGFFIEDYIPEI